MSSTVLVASGWSVAVVTPIPTGSYPRHQIQGEKSLQFELFRNMGPLRHHALLGGQMGTKAEAEAALANLTTNGSKLPYGISHEFGSGLYGRLSPGYARVVRDELIRDDGPEGAKYVALYRVGEDPIDSNDYTFRLTARLLDSGLRALGQSHPITQGWLERMIAQNARLKPIDGH